MAEFTIIQENGVANIEDGSPAGCSLCGSQDGPFVLVGQTTYMVNTINGPLQADKPLQFCAPRYAAEDAATVLRQGCAGSIALAVGYVGPEALAGAQASHREAVERNAQLEEAITALRESQVNVVNVDDLMTLIDEARREPASK